MALFAVALFVSAALLFSVQPMVAKMLLPCLGGTPAVWNICMVFFQAMLLGGYAYAHVLTTRFSSAAQKLVHLGLVTGTFALLLPLRLGAAEAGQPPWNSNPSLWLLRVLFCSVALPFFTLSSSAPLLQQWFSHARHRSSADPYFLYAASNLGSLLGLVAYPLLIEPRFRLQEQNHLWYLGYGVMALLLAACAAAAGRAQPADRQAPAPPAASSDPAGEITWPRRLRRVFGAFIPSSLMLGVTTYLTTDIASVPLLWTIPLGIYLLTFIVAFSRRRSFGLNRLSRILPISALLLVFVMLVKSHDFAWLQICIHLAFFFIAALTWHTRLAEDRPSSRNLTDFYLCLAVGGALGGIFNGLLAPVLFRTVAEYPLMILVACLGWPGDALDRRGLFKQLRDALPWPAALALLTAGIAWISPRFNLEPHLRTLAVVGVPVVLCYAMSRPTRRLQFALALGAVILGSSLCHETQERTVLVERNFFGTLRITRDPARNIVSLYHGTTVHGMQYEDAGRQTEPLSYYYRTGPCGQAMHDFNRTHGIRNVAVIGLGTGTMISYAKPGQHWTFYEIDPAVIRIASGSNYFSYVASCSGSVEFKVGDARARLHEAAPGQFDLLVCDAFGSDAPPLHLLDREALELYLSKLSERGILLFHISSRYLDFRPVLANLAGYFGLQALEGSEDNISEDMLRRGRLPCTWVALARRAEDLGRLKKDFCWEPLPADPSMRLWTDDYSDILGIFQWQ